MFLSNILFFSSMIETGKLIYPIFNMQNSMHHPNYYVVSNQVNSLAIGIVDFRSVLKNSNAMKTLANKFIIIELNKK